MNSLVFPWRTFTAGFTDRSWTTQTYRLHCDANTRLTVTLQVEGRATPGAPIDFFTDAWSIALTPDAQPEPEPEPQPTPAPGGWYDAFGYVVDFDLITDPAARLAYYIRACEEGRVIGPSHDHLATWPPGARSYTLTLPGIPVDRRSALTAYYNNLNPRIVLRYVDAPAEPETPAGSRPPAPARHTPAPVAARQLRPSRNKTGLPRRRRWRTVRQDLRAPVAPGSRPADRKGHRVAGCCRRHPPRD